MHLSVWTVFGSQFSAFLGVIGCIFMIVALAAFVTIHPVPERHLGVYFKGGALLNETTEPGYHFMLRHLKYSIINNKISQ